MYLACINNGNLAMIDKLIKAGADVNDTFLTHGETALMEASRSGNVEVVKTRAEKGRQKVDAQDTIKKTDRDDGTAVEQNHPEVVRLLAAKAAGCQCAIHGGCWGEETLWRRSYACRGEVRPGTRAA